MKETFSPILQAWSHRKFLTWQFRLGLRSNVAGMKIGYLWLLLDPIFLTAIYYFVVVGVFERGGPDFHLVILTGLWPWLWFARSTAQGAVAITSNRGTVLSIPTPLSLYVMGPVILNGFFFVIGLAVLQFLLPVHSPMAYAHLIFLILVLGSLNYASAFVVAQLTVFVRDTTQALNYLVRAGFFLTPVIYEIDRILSSQQIPQMVKNWYAVNPMSILILEMRELLIFGDTNLSESVIWVFLGSIFVLIVAGTTARKFHNQIVERL